MADNCITIIPSRIPYCVHGWQFVPIVRGDRAVITISASSRAINFWVHPGAGAVGARRDAGSLARERAGCSQ